MRSRLPVIWTCVLGLLAMSISHPFAKGTDMDIEALREKLAEQEKRLNELQGQSKSQEPETIPFDIAPDIFYRGVGGGFYLRSAFLQGVKRPRYYYSNNIMRSVPGRDVQHGLVEGLGVVPKNGGGKRIFENPYAPFAPAAKVGVKNGAAPRSVFADRIDIAGCEDCGKRNPGEKEPFAVFGNPFLPFGAAFGGNRANPASQGQKESPFLHSPFSRFGGPAAGMPEAME